MLMKRKKGRTFHDLIAGQTVDPATVGHLLVPDTLSASEIDPKSKLNKTFYILNFQAVVQH